MTLRLQFLKHYLIWLLTMMGLVSPLIVFADESKLVSSDLSTIDNLAIKHLHVRSLAASCAACHGTNGNAVGRAAKLAGMDGKYFALQMLAFKSGERSATVMHRHAKGLNSQEITDLAEYFSSQVPHKPIVLPSQELSKNFKN